MEQSIPEKILRIIDQDVRLRSPGHEMSLRVLATKTT